MDIANDPHFLFARASNCLTNCSTEAPPCDCKPNQNCVLIARSCNQCAYIKCTDKEGGGGGGVNPGVIAGPIVGVALIVASLVLFWWLRRKKMRDLKRLEDLAERARKGESSAFHLSAPGSPGAAVTRSRHASQMLQRSPGAGDLVSQQQQARGALPNVPADAEYYDENGTTIRVYTGKRGVINADPNHPDNGGNGDPFADSRSMSTAGSGQSTNVIPIHYVPAGQSDDTLAQVLQNHRGSPGSAPPTAAQQAAAARTLDQARQNLFRPRNGNVPPPRPARAPDLDLRLNPPAAGGQLTHLAEANASRTSVGSFNSAAPSFLSTNTSNLHLDAPQIVTRQQVHIGRLQAAEVVNVANLRSPLSPPNAASNADPFSGELESTRPSIDSRHFDDEGNVSLSQPSPTDLRFSMGSLAFDRNSVSTTGTGYRPPLSHAERHRFESMSSSHSVGGESLGNFPMLITPASTSASPRSLVPQNMSTTSVDLGGAVPRPPATRPGGAADDRPLTTASSHSAADSFFGSFPFLPPNVQADGSPAGAATAGPPTTSRTNPSRLTLGMSGMSEGLGGFEFNFEGGGVPQDHDDDTAGSKEHVEDPTTPRAPTAPRKW